MSSLYACEFSKRAAGKQMPNKITSSQFAGADTTKEILRKTTDALTKKIERLKCEKRSRQCKLLKNIVQRIYTRNTINNLYKQKAAAEKKRSGLRSEIKRLVSLLLLKQEKIIELKRSNKILCDRVKNIKRVDLCHKKVIIRLRKCVKNLRGKLISLRKNSWKSKGQNKKNNTFLQSALKLSKRASTCKIHPDIAETFLDPKHYNSKDIPETFDDSEKRYEKMAEYLSTRLPSSFIPLTVQQINIMDDDQFRLTVRSANNTNIFFIIPHLCVLTNEDNKEFYFLEKKISSNNPSLRSVCAVMKKGFVVSFHKENFVFEAKSDMSAIMLLRNPFEVANSFIVFPDNTIGTEELHLLTIKEVLRAEFIKLLSMQYEIKIGDRDDEHIVINSVRDLNTTRTEAELVHALFDVYRDILNDYRYSHNTFYNRDTETNVWNSLTHVEFTHHIRIHLTLRIRLTEAEQINISTNDTILKIRDIIVHKIEDVNFSNQLDSIPHIFVTDDKVIDMSIIRPVIRSIKGEDLIKTPNEWTYDPALSHKYRKSVESYFNKLLPKPCEQKWFLSFIARMLNRKRCKAPCVILTDNRGGKSGKSTLTYLLRSVFGIYYLSDSTIEVLGISSLENKRLFVDEELYCRTPSVLLVQAGLIIIVSQHGVPILKTNDKDLEGIVTCPMRSRFVSKTEMAHMKKHGEDMTDTYIADDSLPSRFFEWKSAMLDLLLEFYEESLSPVPESMIDFNNSILYNND